MRRSLPVIALVASVLPLAAAATVALALSLAEQARRSDLVVLARVLEQHTFQGEDSNLYTDSTLALDEVLKGRAPGPQLVVRQMGGTLGDRAQLVPGDARLAPGELAVLFLADREPEAGVVFLTALAQSKLDVVGTAADGSPLLSRDLSGLLLLDASKTRVVHPEPALTLNRLRAEIAAP